MSYIVSLLLVQWKPKGIGIPNDGVLRLVLNPNYCKLSNQNVIAQMNNLGFDATTFEIWGAFLNGAKLVLIEKKICYLRMY